MNDAVPTAETREQALARLMEKASRSCPCERAAMMRYVAALVDLGKLRGKMAAGGHVCRPPRREREAATAEEYLEQLLASGPGGRA
jgi:hypothetical protein